MMQEISGRQKRLASELRDAREEAARLSRTVSDLSAKLEDAEQRVRMANGENEVLKGQIGLLASQEQANREMLDAIASRFVLLRTSRANRIAEEDVL